MILSLTWGALYLGWEYLEEKLTIDLTDDLRTPIDPAPFGRRALEEDRGPSIRERLEQSRQECRNKNKAQAPHKGKSEPEL